MSLVRINAATIGGIIQTAFSGPVQVPADGIITVDSRDVASLLALGCSYINAVTRWQNVSVPIAATAGRIVASASLANGTLSLAHQPDQPRVCAFRADPGGGTITAGQGVMTYTANDGSAVVDTVSLVGSTVVSSNTSRAVVHMTSVVVSGLAGGTSPLVQVNDTNILGMMVDAGFADFAVLKENVDNADETIGTVASSAAGVTPSTAPNGTHSYAFAYSYNMPNT